MCVCACVCVCVYVCDPSAEVIRDLSLANLRTALTLSPPPLIHLQPDLPQPSRHHGYTASPHSSGCTSTSNLTCLSVCLSPHLQHAMSLPHPPKLEKGGIDLNGCLKVIR